MRKLLMCLLIAASCLDGCASKQATANISEHTVAVDATAKSEDQTTVEENESEPEREVKPDHNYREYIPIWQNGAESNLYDMLSNKEIIYIRRYNCPDCEKYEESIIRQIQNTGIPYMVLECSKQAEEWTEGYAIPSAVVKSIGIEEIPAVVFVMNGTFLTRIENQFSQEGNEIEMVAESAFQ